MGATPPPTGENHHSAHDPLQGRRTDLEDIVLPQNDVAIPAATIRNYRALHSQFTDEEYAAIRAEALGTKYYIQ